MSSNVAMLTLGMIVAGRLTDVVRAALDLGRRGTSSAARRGGRRLRCSRTGPPAPAAVRSGQPLARCRAQHTQPRSSRRPFSIAGVAARRDFTRESLAAGVRAGDRRALARAITLVENCDPLAYEVVRDLYPETGGAYAVGVTGPPGVGKSSLISALVRPCARAQDRSVGVISVDPSSPFSQGALLGDRIRLADHFLDPERLHPLDGQPRPPRRARGGDAAGAARARRRRARTSSSSRRSAPARARSR